LKERQQEHLSNYQRNIRKNSRMGSGSSSQPRAPLTLYSFPLSPPCRAVLMVGEAAKINFNLKNIDISKQEQNSDSFRSVNPDGTVPTLVDGSLTLWESRAVLQYLLDRYAPNHSLYPRDPVRRAYIDRMLQYDISNISPMILQFARPQILFQQPPDPEKQKNLEKSLDYMEKILKKTQYLAGDQISIADVSVVAHANMLELIKWDFSRWPRVKEWLRSMQSQPWYARPNKPLEDLKNKKPA